MPAARLFPPTRTSASKPTIPPLTKLTSAAPCSWAALIPKWSLPPSASTRRCVRRDNPPAAPGWPRPSPPAFTWWMWCAMASRYGRLSLPRCCRNSPTPWPCAPPTRISSRVKPTRLPPPFPWRPRKICAWPGWTTPPGPWPNTPPCPRNSPAGFTSWAGNWPPTPKPPTTRPRPLKPT